MPEATGKDKSGLGDFASKIGDILGVVNRSVVRQGPNAGSISVTGLLGNIADEPQRQKERKLLEQLQEAKLKKIQQDLSIGRLDETAASNQLANFTSATRALQGETDNPDLVGALSTAGRSDVAKNSIVQQQNLEAKTQELNLRQKQRIDLSIIKSIQAADKARQRGRLERRRVKLQGRITRRNQTQRVDEEIRGSNAKTKAPKSPTFTEIQGARKTIGERISFIKQRGFDDKGNPLINRADVPLIQATGDLAAGLMRDGVSAELAVNAAQDALSASTGGARLKFPPREMAKEGFSSKLMESVRSIVLGEIPNNILDKLSESEQGLLAAVGNTTRTHVQMALNPATKDMALPLQTQADIGSYLEFVVEGLQEAGYDVSLGPKGLQGNSSSISPEFISGIQEAIVAALPDISPDQSQANP